MNALIELVHGIFNWSLDGLQKLRARGRFQQPHTSKDAIRELEDLASPVGAFVRDRCRIGPDLTVEVNALYVEYRRWCDNNGRRASNKTVFGRDLRAARPGLKLERPWASGQQRPRHYVGLTIRDIMDCADVDREEEPSVHTVHGMNHCSANAEPDDALHRFEERAATLEFDAGLTRDEAEAQAADETRPEMPPEFVRRRAGR